jgi:RimJ/RimL family protein N-acetyltransferase
MATMETERLLLRRWHAGDRKPLALINQDPAVMEYFPAVLSRTESDEMVARIEAHFRRHGFGLWAAELRETEEFVGFIGLAVPRFEAAFMPCVEIGWRLAHRHWGNGLATEGARAAMRYAFEHLGLPSLASFTVPANLRSRRVMEKLGMTHNPADDFDHPRLPADHVLCRHVLYRVSCAEWMHRNAETHAAVTP